MFYTMSSISAVPVHLQQYGYEMLFQFYSTANTSLRKLAHAIYSDFFSAVKIERFNGKK